MEDIELYIAHLKSSSGYKNEAKRHFEILEVMQNIENEHCNDFVILGGDMNFYNCYEAAYQEITQSIKAILIDPVGKERLGDWHNNKRFARYHTQSPRNTQFGGGAHGGLDDRFDYIFISDEFYKRKSTFKYCANSYEVVGNNGELFDNELNSNSNSHLPDSIADALYYMSDHLPVVIEIMYNRKKDSLHGNKFSRREKTNKY